MNAQTQADPERHVFSPQQVAQNTISVIKDRHDNKSAGIRTGITSLDEYLLPMRPGELVSVVGYTSNYKSGLMAYIARHNANKITDDKSAVITFTWEQSIEEQGVIDIAQLTRIDATKMLRGDLTELDWTQLYKGAVQRGSIPWWLVGHSSEGSARRPRLSMSDAGRMLEYIVDVQKIQPVLIVLDYLQRVRRESGATLREGFMEIVDRAKDMALAFRCPVILGSQAGRGVRERAWRLPMLDDSQETSNLEQSSDKFISVWLPKNDYAIGDIVEWGGRQYSVTPNLLVCGIMKQKLGIAPKIIPLHVRPEVNEIAGIETRQL